MKPFLSLGLAALAGLSAAAVPLPADARGPGPHHHHHHHHVRGFVGLSLGIGWPAYWAGSPYAYYPAVPGGYTVAEPLPAAPAEPPPLPPAVASPRSGQDPRQTEADWHECNRWATTQPDAMADAQAFQRTAAACMEGHGYSVK